MALKHTYEIKSHLGLVVANCTQDFDINSTLTKWDTRPHQTKQDQVMALRQFYKELKKGRYQKRMQWDVGPNIALAWAEDKIMPHERTGLTEFTRKRKPRIIEHPHFNEVIALDINTDYASFGFLDKGTPQHTVTGKLEFFVETKQDISEPLSRLISATSIYNVNSEDIVKQLRHYHPY